MHLRFRFIVLAQMHFDGSYLLGINDLAPETTTPTLRLKKKKR